MEVFNVDTLTLFVLFFVPGFVSIKVYELIVPSDKRNWSESILEAVSYSCLNFALLFWLVLLINKEGFIVDHPASYYFGTVMILFVFPAVWPIIGKSMLSAKFLRGKVLHLTPKSWDYFFAKGQPCWVLVHLKNGELIGGLYSEESFSSSYPNIEDVYLEQVWKVDENGEFTEKVAQTMGLWVNKEYFDYLEFFSLDDLEMKEDEQETDARSGVSPG